MKSLMGMDLCISRIKLIALTLLVCSRLYLTKGTSNRIFRSIYHKVD